LTLRFLKTSRKDLQPYLSPISRRARSHDVSLLEENIKREYANHEYDVLDKLASFTHRLQRHCLLIQNTEL